MSPINLSSEIASEIREAMSGDRIELPFPAPVLWWANGKANGSKKDSGVQYFGGWACNVEDMQLNAPSVPATFHQEQFTNNEGTTYDVFAARSVAVALIARRKRWIAETNKGHTQILAYMATVEGQQGDKHYIPWNPVVLSAKSYAAIELEAALTKWEKDTITARRQFANNAPAWFFYAPLGTFGGERKQRMVGKTQQSPITPCTVYTPKEFDEPTLERIFVGETIATVMLDLKRQAAEWLDAWKNGKADQPQHHAEQEAPPNFEDEAPF